MHGAARLVFAKLFILLSVIFTSARASDLHPLSDALPAAEIVLRIGLPGGGRDAEALECAYRPRRERDVKKERHFHLLPSIWRIGSNNLMTTHREASHSTHRAVEAREGAFTFRVPLRDPEPGYEDFQLHSVRLGRLDFAVWSAQPPALAPEFGLAVSPDALRGSIRAARIAAAPLGGKLPLWPALRTVELRVDAGDFPEVRLWDDSTKHHWDGWRSTTPAYSKSGHDVVHARPGEPTVWWSHTVHPYPRPLDPARPEDSAASAGVLGASLEIFWPEGATLALPDASFEREVTVAAFPLAALTARGRALLAQAATLTPGVELGSLRTAEWEALEALGADHDPVSAVALSMQAGADGRCVLQLQRAKLSESWIFLFAAPYDSGARHAVQALVVHPAAWGGARPE